MKQTLWSRLLLFFALTVVSMSCDRDDIYLPPSYNHPNGSCLVTESTDDIMGFSYVFTYNAQGDPVTATNTIITYDSRDRLIKADYSAGATSYYREFRYSDRSYLPSSSRLYYQGDLVQTELYSYERGRLAEIDKTGVFQSVHFNRVYRITYNGNGNVKTITQSDQEEPLYEGISYDNKPNIFGGNQWLKYLMFASESGYFLYQYQLLSANNPTQWTLNNEDGGLKFTASSSYEYNEEGYAAKNTTLLQAPNIGGDGVDELTGTQINTFNCED
ncbi:hypothetical protein ACXYMU_20270 [Pontibacter sp. CAU 1760]